MANKKLEKILREGGGTAWNEWRYVHRDRQINLRKAELSFTNLGGADLRCANLNSADFTSADLTKANLVGADLGSADFVGAHLIGANLGVADLRGAYLRGANFTGANLTGANLTGAHIFDANLSEANLAGAKLMGANLKGGNLAAAYLSGADLTGANLRGADLSLANLVGTRVNDAKLSDCKIYGISVWDLKGVPKDQSNLVITEEGEAVVTVDNLKLAQFVYLMLHNPNIREVIDTIGKKGVLILGRFGERLAVLNALRQKLRERDFVPMVFDFERAESKDFTETVVTLAGMSAFIIADITQPRSVQQELTAVVPNYMVPFAPIIQKGEEPYAMFVDLQNKYEKWVLDLLEYADVDQLLRVSDVAIIEPAEKRRHFLLSEKAKAVRRRYAAEFEK